MVPVIESKPKAGGGGGPGAWAGVIFDIFF